jgi:hypothetical protein
MARSPAFLAAALLLAATALPALGRAAATPPRTSAVRSAPPRASRPQVTLAGLDGATEAETRTRIGAPDLARTEGLGALWTYRLENCALLVFFRSEGGGPRRLSGALSSPRRRGETPPTVDACLAEAAARAAPAARR